MDQATELRNLVLRAARARVPQGQLPRTLVLASGRGDVGVTTISIRLAIALAEQGLRVMLADVDTARADVAPRCGVPDFLPLSEILTGSRDLHELVVPGPAGIQILPGGTDGVQELDDTHEKRLVEQLRGLERHTDLLMVDGGSNWSPLTGLLASLSEDLVVVTTPESGAIMDGYLLLKRRSQQGPPRETRVHILVNRADPETAEDVFRRMQASCRRFLSLEVRFLGHVPHHNETPAPKTPAITPGAWAAEPMANIARRLMGPTALGRAA